MPDAERRSRVDELARRSRQMPDVGGAAALVGDDGHLVALGAEPEHRAHEVVPRRAEEPRAAHDPGALAGGSLAVELRAAVRGQRAGLSDSTYGRTLATVEHVVGGVRHERCAERGGVGGAADVDGGSALRDRPRHHRRPSTRRCAARGPAGRRVGRRGS